MAAIGAIPARSAVAAVKMMIGSHPGNGFVAAAVGAMVMRSLDMRPAGMVSFAVAITRFGKIGKREDHGERRNHDFCRILHDDWTHFLQPSGWVLTNP